MMKFWEDWKEKLKKFLKADVLAECRQQVDHENRVVLCVLNSSMVCCHLCWHFTYYGENRQTITMNICVFYMQHCF